MKFNLIDKVESVSGERIVAVKYVSLAEEYLADHFPTFPVLPGVMMLEAGTQACGWVMHVRTGFAKALAVMKEAKNVKYGHFVAPGNFLRVEAELVKESPSGAVFKVGGTVVTGGVEKQAFAARVEMAYFDLGEKRGELGHLDERLKAHNRARWGLIAPAGAANLGAGGGVLV